MFLEEGRGRQEGKRMKKRDAGAMEEGSRRNKREAGEPTKGGEGRKRNRREVRGPTKHNQEGQTKYNQKPARLKCGKENMSAHRSRSWLVAFLRCNSLPVAQ